MSKDNLENQVFVKHEAQENLTCTICEETKHHSNFKKRRGGYVSTSCRKCVNIKYERNPAQAHLNAIRCRAKQNNLPCFNLFFEEDRERIMKIF